MCPSSTTEKRRKTKQAHDTNQIAFASIETAILLSRSVYRSFIFKESGLFLRKSRHHRKIFQKCLQIMLKMAARKESKVSELSRDNNCNTKSF